MDVIGNDLLAQGEKGTKAQVPDIAPLGKILVI